MVADMNEIRCPMCGKPNPAENDVCQFCQARLKPLTGPISDLPGGRDEDDWLGSLRSEGDLSDAGDTDWIDDGEAASDDDQRDPLDWLSNLDDRAGVGRAAGMQRPEKPIVPEPEPSDRDFEVSSQESPAEEVDLSAWLASLDDEQSEAGPSRPGRQGSEDLPEWLTEFQGSSSEAESDDDDLPDWLNGSGEAVSDGAPDAEPEAPPEEDEGLPEWLSEIGSGPHIAEKPAEIEGDKQLPEEPIESGELPDWLAAIGAASGEVEEESLEPTDAGEIGGEDEGLPDWLSAVGSGPHVADEPAELDAGAEAPLEPGEVPDWLAEIGPAEGPGWLASEEDVTGENVPADAEPELSEWLQEVLPGDLAQEAASEAGEEREVELYDFLGEGFDEEKFPAAEFSEAGLTGAPEAAQAPGEAASGEAFEAEEIPDWLDDIAPSTDDLPVGLGDTNLAAPEGETSDWLSELASDVEGGVESQDEEAQRMAAASLPFLAGMDFDQDLESLDLLEEPDWLAEVADEAVAEQREDEESEIARANLPEWLAAMRPVDSIVTPKAAEEEGSMEVESAGPLAGLHDVLPAEQQLFEISRPEPHSIKLDVTESQQKHIVMLQQMLKQEEVAPAVGRDVFRAAPQRLFRWIIALTLIITAIFGLVSGTQISDLPIASAEILAVSNTIDSLPAQAPVLVAVDYEPGLSAEMDTLAEALLNHLMLRGVRLTLISTTPTGPLLGEMLLETLQSSHNYDRGAQFVNLGYISGGATGLQALADYPLRLSLPYTFSGYEPWEPRLAPLAGVEQINDYAAVLVLSDRQETARAWIEQIGPILQAPLLLGTSAQIGPLVRPYFGEAPNLVAGYVSGIAGSGAYERLTGVPGRATATWNAFSLLVLAAAGVILIGSVVNYSLSLNRQKTSSEGGQTHESA